MQASSKEGKALLKALSSAKVGGAVDLGLSSPFAALKEPTQALLVEVEPDRFYQMALYWLGCHLCDVVVEVRGTELVTEML